MTIKILSDEDNDTKVGIETVTDVERGEDDKPGGGAREEVVLYLENHQYREYC